MGTITVSRDNDDCLSGDNDEIKFILFLNQGLYLSSSQSSAVFVVNPCFYKAEVWEFASA